ncbi:YoaK family protein [Aspergillus stella-maris]|uniref:YoaK family protein n=1 Tax=Aspergillus stella-maris TaxID=1810926 RepID=UPI003CCCD7DB
MAAATDIEATANPGAKVVGNNAPAESGTSPASGDNKTAKSATSRWTQSVSSQYTDLVCLICCFITGLCDSAAYNAWSCFLAMQTGNTIFLGLGASNQPTGKPWGWLKSLISIIFFFSGAFLFSLYGRNFGAKKRMTLFSSFLFQAILVIIAVALLEADLIPHETSETESLTGGRLFLELIPIAMLAFQSAGSMTAARGLGYNEIPTVVLTSVYFDVASDPKIVSDVKGNVKRNRRVGSIVLLVIGAICGGWLSRSSGGMESALWLSAGLKVVIALGWLVWRGE